MKISGKKRKRSLILLKVDLYGVCALLFKMIYYCYYFYNNTSFPSARFVAYLILGESSLAIISQEASSWRETRREMSGGGRSCLYMDSTRHAKI